MKYENKKKEKKNPIVLVIKHHELTELNDLDLGELRRNVSQVNDLGRLRPVRPGLLGLMIAWLCASAAHILRRVI